MQLFSKNTYISLFGALLCVGSLQLAAVDTTETSDVVKEVLETLQTAEVEPADKYIPAGTRGMLPIEVLTNLQRLSAEDSETEATQEEAVTTEEVVQINVTEEIKEDAKSEEIVSEQQVVEETSQLVTEDISEESNNEASQTEVASNDSLKETLDVPEAGIKKSKKSKSQHATYRAPFITSHAGVIHQPLLVTAFGENVQLEDGSIWKVNPNDSFKTLNWYTNHIITIAPNNAWFSAYGYVLVNQTLDVSVEVSLILFVNPVWHSIYNHRIIAIDDISQRVWLEDGSIWSIHSSDYSRKWMLNDTIIIGLNNGWYSTSRPNILINADILHHVRAICTQH